MTNAASQAVLILYSGKVFEGRSEYVQAEAILCCSFAATVFNDRRVDRAALEL
jgi:hypothetical protein